MFLVMSVACAFAQNLGQMIVLRALQGFFGGVLIPLAFTITLTMLPKAKQPVGLALFAVSATFAPAIGPTIGGYLTETYGWQYIFYVNLIPGAIMLATLWPSLRPAPMKLGLLRQGDWPGIATLAIGLAALADGAGGRQQGRLVRLAVHPAAVGRRRRLPGAVPLDRADQPQAPAQPEPAEAPQLRPGQPGERHHGDGPLRLGLPAAGLPVADAGLQRRAGRHGAGLDRVAATGADPLRAVPDAPFRHASSGRRRLRAIRAELLHEPGNLA